MRWFVWSWFSMMFLGLPLVVQGQSCVGTYTNEFAEGFDPGVEDCQGVPSVYARSPEVYGTVTLVDFTIVDIPDNVFGTTMMIVNPDSTEFHVLRDASVQCDYSMIPQTLVDWSVLFSAAEVTIELTTPVSGATGDGVWSFYIWSGDGSGVFDMKVNLGGPVCVQGCTSPNACNFNPLANVDDGTCNSNCSGCTNPLACNYEASALVDDGSCILPFSADGCCVTTLNVAGSLAGLESLTVPFGGFGQPLSVDATVTWTNLGDSSWPSDLMMELTNGNGTCISWGGFNVPSDCPVGGSWPTNWSNTTASGVYTASFPLDLSEVGLANGLLYGGPWNLTLINGWTSSLGVNVSAEIQITGLCPFSGCTDVEACNYNALASDDDGTCLFPDCAGVCGGNAVFDQCGVCDGNNSTCTGCTSPNACNFEPNALIDDGSCLELDCAGVCGGNGEQVVLVNNPLIELVSDQILPTPTPIITYFSGWFGGEVLVQVFNPTPQNIAGVSLVVELGSSTDYLESAPAFLGAQESIWFSTDVTGNYFPFPQEVGLIDEFGNQVNIAPLSFALGVAEDEGAISPNSFSPVAWSSVQLLAGGTVLDALGTNDPGAGASLSELTIAGVPFAAAQHALARKDYVIWGDPSGLAEANRSDACQSTWDVLDENENVPLFVPAWSLNASIEVAVNCETGACLNDVDGDGICDELEIPEVPWCGDVNATNYGPASLALQCMEPSIIEYLVSSCCCCSTAVPVNAPPPTAGLLPEGGGATSSMMSSDCGQDAKSLAYCFEGARAFVTDPQNKQVRILDYSNVNYPQPLFLGGSMPAAIDTCPNGNLNWAPTDVDVWNPGAGNFAEGDTSVCCSTMVAVSWADPGNPLDSGLVAFYDSDGVLVDPTYGVVPTGPGVSSIHFSDDGRWLVTANPGAGLSAGSGSDPLGSVTAIDVSSYGNTPMSTDYSGIEVHQIDFGSISAVGGLPSRLTTDIWSGSFSAGQILEPTSIQMDPNNHTAWVNCQGNNALVEIDLDLLTMGNPVVGAWGWGVRDMETSGGMNASNNGDASVDTGTKLYGWRQPREMEVFKYGSHTYGVTTNEGAPREITAGTFHTSTLTSGPYTGLEHDPEYGFGLTATAGDSVYVFGARSFTIWRLNPGVEPALLYDSGSEIESRLALLMPDHANSLESTIQSGDMASSARGPEPTGVAVGKVKSAPHLFVALEAMGGVMMYELNLGDTVTTPSAEFSAYATNRLFNADPSTNACLVGDLGTEDVLYLQDLYTDAGFDAVLAANDFTGTVCAYGLAPVLPGCTDSCACNYNEFATEDDGSCEFITCAGCTYTEASNYAPDAELDDGTCVFEDSCPADLNDSGAINTDDLLIFLSAYGTTCP